jgi:hypothetical protein
MTGTVIKLLTIQPLSFISFLISDFALCKHPSCQVVPHANWFQLVMSGCCISFYTKRHNFSRHSKISTLKSFIESMHYHQMEKLPYHVFQQCVAMPLRLEQYKFYYTVLTIHICRISQFNEISISITEYDTNAIFMTWSTVLGWNMVPICRYATIYSHSSTASSTPKEAKNWNHFTSSGNSSIYADLLLGVTFGPTSYINVSIHVCVCLFSIYGASLWLNPLKMCDGYAWHHSY